LANGGDGPFAASGGGAGGGILLHGHAVVLLGVLSAIGGRGAPGLIAGNAPRNFLGAGGGGGGGQVVISAAAGGFTNMGGTMNVAGGAGGLAGISGGGPGFDGGPGVIVVVPEPGILQLAGTGLLVLVVYRLWRRQCRRPHLDPTYQWNA
jgi:hypothetical protein